MTQHHCEDISVRLRVARDHSGISLRQIAEATKLPVRSLDALEQGRIAQLPSGIYRRALVRAFAAEVGLDPEDTLRQFLAQHPDDLPAPAAAKRQQKDSWGYAVREAAPVAPPRPRTLQSVVSIVGALVPIAAGMFYFAGSARGADDTRQMGVVASRQLLAPTEVARTSSSFDAIRHADGAVSMRITVSSRCQLQVMADGREVLARSLAAGEHLQVPLTSDVVLVGDDAGAVQFSINGRAGRQLGRAGTPLSVRIARDGYESWLINPN